MYMHDAACQISKPAHDELPAIFYEREPGAAWQPVPRGYQQRLRGRRLGIHDGETGSVTFVQRFGGILNLNPHFHTIIPDGLFVPGTGNKLNFILLPPPEDSDIQKLIEFPLTVMGMCITVCIAHGLHQTESQRSSSIHSPFCAALLHFCLYHILI